MTLFGTDPGRPADASVWVDVIDIWARLGPGAQGRQREFCYMLAKLLKERARTLAGSAGHDWRRVVWGISTDDDGLRRPDPRIHASVWFDERA